MPPEPLPWDRKEYAFKDQRKHERGDALGGGGGGGGGSSSASRWKDPYHGGPRDLLRASPRRPFSSHCRQGGGYHQVHPDDSVGHGCTPSRSERFWSEDDGYRPASVRHGGCYRTSSSGSSRENRGSFRRSPCWDSGDFSRQHRHDPYATALRSVAAPISSTSQIPLKEQNDKTGGVDDGLGTGHIFDHRDHSLGSIPWKKWSRPGSLGFTKTSRSESEEACLEGVLPSGKENPIQSLVTLTLPPDEVAPRKKPRLGWGQGLAKYEKQKVEGSVETSVGGSKGSLSDDSQKVTSISGCLSPTTPCSATCSSSPGTEDKLCSRTVNDYDGMNQNSDLPGSAFLSFCEEISNNLDHLEVNPIRSLDSLLTDLFQSVDAFSGDSTFSRDSAMNKLLKLKGSISNGLEKIECEIDLLEKELKSLNCDTKTDSYQSSVKLANDSASEPCIQPLAGLSDESNPSKDQKVETIEVAFVEEHVPCGSLVKHDTVIKDIYIINPETLSSKFHLAIEKLSESPLLIKDEKLKVTEMQKIVDSDCGERMMVASEDGNRYCGDGDCSSVHVSFDEATQGKDSNLITSIIDSNMNAAKCASKVFGTSFSTNPLLSDIWGLVNFTSCRKNDLKIKEKLATRKCQLRFKERVLILKFKALHHLWKEDLRLLSIKKVRTKSSKRFELMSRSSQNGSQKQRSSTRSRFASPVGNLTLVPTTEIVNFTSKLLSDAQIKLCRNNLKMPTLLLDDKERKYNKFVTQNGLIKDPPSFEKERAMINPWSEDEKDIFMEMLARYGKDFTKISSSLNHKTTADCIEFYYKNHKSESFKEVKKWLDLRKQQQQCLPANTYLVASGKKWNHEMNASSLDMLGAASAVVAHDHCSSKSEKYAGSAVYGTCNDMKVSYGSSYLEGENSVDVSGQERDFVAADVLAGICGALSSETMSSCVTSFIHPAERINRITMDQLLTPEVTQNLDEEEACSDEGCELGSADWTDEEKSIFIQALGTYDKDFTKISSCMRTRSREQCKIFFSKARKCLGLDVIRQGTVLGGTPLSDANGGRSDTDDACVAEMDSAICSTQSCSKVDVDVSQSVANTSYEGIVHAAGNPFHAETDRSNEPDGDVFPGPNLVGGDEKVNNKVSIFHDDKLASQGDNLQSNTHPKESIAAGLGCAEDIQLCEVADSADRETIVGGSTNVVSPNVSILTIGKTEPVVEACLEVESTKSTSSTVCNVDTTGGSLAEGLKVVVKTEASLSSKVGLSKKNTTNINLTANGKGLLCCGPDSNASAAALFSGTVANVCHLAFDPRYQQQIQLDLQQRKLKQPQAILLKQENVHHVPLNSLLPDPSSICFGGTLNVSSETTLNFEQGNKWHQNLLKRGIYQQYMPRKLSVNQVDRNMHILRGYPLQAPSQDVMREVDLTAGEKPSLLEAECKTNVVPQSNQFFMSDKHWNENNLFPSNSGILRSSRSENQSEAEIRTCIKNASSEIEEHKTGDVKLFGKILSHTSPLPQSSSSSHESNPRTSPELDGSSTTNCASIRRDNNRLVPNIGSGQVGLEALPVRTYGFWDGKRIQTGFSSLPETASMLAKYQGSLTGVSLYSAKDGMPSGNGVLTDYQQSYVQHLSSNGKRVENISELQKRNGGIEMVSGFQQQGRVAPLGAKNMMGGGILVGGGGGVSDPVAALKMHYAARVSTLNNNIEAWRADMGDR
ncbi:unnamed protein product [Musa hybrid cultivar]